MIKIKRHNLQTEIALAVASPPPASHFTCVLLARQLQIKILYGTGFNGPYIVHTPGLDGIK